ncbi:MAG: trypsin-like peptidase domain-containing protein [Ignavibacteriales bacterium]|nr:trypsin-like peptidase domain-containing protein [Ignavibacteriales bacterium]
MNSKINAFIVDMFFLLTLTCVICLSGKNISAQISQDFTGYDLSQKLLSNVVRIEGLKKGFGFIVAEQYNSLYIVTANHNVRDNMNSDISQEPEVSFYINGNIKTYTGKLLSSHQAAPRDIAVIKIDKPVELKWQPDCMASLNKSLTGVDVWFIGRELRWWVPFDPGYINSSRPNANSIIEVEINSIKPGTSGAPLICDKGIIGMVIIDTGAGVAKALAIDEIKASFQSWGHPWSLEKNIHSFSNCTLSIEEKNRFESKVLTAVGQYRYNPVSNVNSDKKNFKELIDYIHEHPNCKEELAREVSLLYRAYGSSIILSGHDPRMEPIDYLNEAFPYFKKSYEMYEGNWSQSNDQAAYKELEKIKYSNSQTISLFDYFLAVFTIAMPSAPEYEVSTIVTIMVQKLMPELIRESREDLQYFYSYPNNTNSCKDFMISLLTYAEGMDGTLEGPNWYPNRDNTTTVRYVLKGKAGLQEELVWIVEHRRESVIPTTKLAKSVHKFILENKSSEKDHLSALNNLNIAPLNNEVEVHKANQIRVFLYYSLNREISADKVYNILLKSGFSVTRNSGTTNGNKIRYKSEKDYDVAKKIKAILSDIETFDIERTNEIHKNFDIIIWLQNN